jgi:hypothetical protein
MIVPRRCFTKANRGAYFFVAHIVFQVSFGISSNAAR